MRRCSDHRPRWRLQVSTRQPAEPREASQRQDDRHCAGTEREGHRTGTWGPAAVGSQLHTHLAGAGATLGFSVSMMVSVIMAAVVPPDTAELPKPPKPGAFLPCLSASLLACCSSLALRRISAFASRSWVWTERQEAEGSRQSPPALRGTEPSCPASEGKGNRRWCLVYRKVKPWRDPPRCGAMALWQSSVSPPGSAGHPRSPPAQLGTPSPRASPSR